jgi:hypothetical protein
MEGIIAIIMVFSIPLSAIIGGYYLQLKKISAKQGGLTSQEKKMVERILLENEELRKRVENLEMIVTDPDLLKLHGVEKRQQPQLGDSNYKD